MAHATADEWSEGRSEREVEGEGQSEGRVGGGGGEREGSGEGEDGLVPLGVRGRSASTSDLNAVLPTAAAFDMEALDLEKVVFTRVGLGRVRQG